MKIVGKAFLKKNTDGKLIQTSSLTDFQARLGEDPSLSRFILDAKFLENVPGDPIEFYLPNALRFITEMKGEVTRIVIYSAEDLDTLRGALPSGIPIDRVRIFQKGNTSVESVLNAVLS